MQLGQPCCCCCCCGVAAMRSRAITWPCPWTRPVNPQLARFALRALCLLYKRLCVCVCVRTFFLCVWITQFAFCLHIHWLFIDQTPASRSADAHCTYAYYIIHIYIYVYDILRECVYLHAIWPRLTPLSLSCVRSNDRDGAYNLALRCPLGFRMYSESEGCGFILIECAASDVKFIVMWIFSYQAVQVW